MSNEDTWLLIGILFVVFCVSFFAFLYKSEKRDPHERTETLLNSEMSVLRLRIEQEKAKERAALNVGLAADWQARSLARRAEIADINLLGILEIEGELQAAERETFFEEHRTQQVARKAAQEEGHLLESREDVYKRMYGAEWGQMEAQVEGKKHLDALERYHQEKLGQIQIEQRKQLDEWNKKRMEEYGHKETGGQSDSEEPDVRGGSEDTDDGGDA